MTVYLDQTRLGATLAISSKNLDSCRNQESALLNFIVVSVIRISIISNLNSYNYSSSCSVDEFSDYLDEVEEELKESRRDGLPVVLLGHSLGGLIALDYLTSDRPHPDYAVISSPGLGGGKAWQRALAPKLGRFLPRFAIPTAITAEQLSRDPAVGEAYFADPLVSRKTTARLGAELFAAGDRVRSNLAALSVPSLVIHGGADELVPAAVSAPLQDLPGVERRLYPKLRHESLNEPDGPEVVADIIDWLRAKVAAPAG